jgi:hypothetical protein
MKHKWMIALSLIFSLTLTACGATPDPASEGNTSPGGWTEQTTQTDDQGAVTVEITPLNLANAGETLDFQVVLDTHSVDLSMDLAALATLTTDTGKTSQALKWDAPLGGHHVEGTLSFPAAMDGSTLLEGASQITLTIKDLDAPQRVFVWER